MSIAELSHVSKRFDIRSQHSRSFQETVIKAVQRRRDGGHEHFWALRDVSFQTKPGETLALIGTNGSGKSTALKLLTRIIYPTSGKVNVAGRVAALLELGTGFHPDLTGRENIYLNGSIMGLSRAVIKKRMDEIVHFSELDRFLDVPVRAYSSGMTMRLGFAVATHVDPDLLLIDEVLAVGDQAFQAKCMQHIEQLQRRGTTIVLVSHDLSTVQQLCQRCIWLDQGQICAEGTADDVVAQYLSQRGAGKRGWTVSNLRPGGKVARWGSGEVEIDCFELLNGDGEPVQAFTVGEKMTVRLWYHATAEVKRPAFGIAIYDEAGTVLTSPNCLQEGHVVSLKAGSSGTVDYVMDALPLLTGTYDLTVAVYDQHIRNPYDHQHKVGRFIVQDPELRRRDGKVLLDARWHIT